MRIMVVEDDESIADVISCLLAAEGFEVTHEANGLKALALARAQAIDLFILDRDLPGMEGLELCRRLRRFSNVPVLFLSSHGQTLDRVAGLEVGGTDYMAKPFDPDELVARVRAQLRLYRPPEATQLSFEDLVVDLDGRLARRGEQAVPLTAKEFDLLVYLLKHPRQVKTREQILEAVWSYDFGGQDNVLEVTISHLRAKLDRGALKRLIQTVRGIGYVLRAEDEG